MRLAADVAVMAAITRSSDWPAVLGRYFAAGGTMEAARAGAAPGPRAPGLRLAVRQTGHRAPQRTGVAAKSTDGRPRPTCVEVAVTQAPSLSSAPATSPRSRTRTRSRGRYTARVTLPLILLSNDDGYHSEGIQVLADALESLGEVWVVAPDRENSAVSHALTLSRPLRLTQLGERRFAVDGTPTDCVTLGVGQVLKGRRAGPGGLRDQLRRQHGRRRPLLGHGLGGVRGRRSSGVPAIAVSQVIGERVLVRAPARFARLIATRVLERGLPPGDAAQRQRARRARPRGVRFTRLGKRRYTEGVVEDTDPRGRKCYWIGGGDPVWEDIPGTDFAAVGAGYISITPLQLDMTDGAARPARAARSPPGTWRAPEVTPAVPVRRKVLIDYLRESGITDERVLAAMAAVPREHVRAGARSAIRPTRTTRSRSARGRRSRSPRWWRGSRSSPR